MKDQMVIVCSDSLEQQAQLSGQLALHYDNIIGCQLTQVEGMLTDPQSSVMV
ncbi:two-component response regulatory protein, partial [Vibrio nigripulchritudo ATCC 27043]